MRHGFGDCVFDSDTRELLRAGRPVHLSPKAFRLLELLLLSRPRAVSKSDLKDAIWPGTFVLETNLANLAGELRAAFGETGKRSRWLRTVHGFGYAFSGETRPESRGPAADVCRVRLDEREIELAAAETVLGRDRGLGVRIDDTTVSRRHARIVIDEKGATIEDLGSKNGTFVSGRAAEGPVPLRDGDEIQVGSVFLTFLAGRDARSTVTARRQSRAARARRAP